MPALIYIVMSKGTHGAKFLEHSGVYLCPLFEEVDDSFCDKSQVTVLHFGGSLRKIHLLAWVNLYESIYDRLHKTKGLRFITLTTLSRPEALARLRATTGFINTQGFQSWKFTSVKPHVLTHLANYAEIELDAEKGSSQLLLLDKSGEIRKGLRNTGEKGDGMRHNANSFSSLKKGLLEDIKILLKEYYYSYKSQRSHDK